MYSINHIKFSGNTMEKKYMSDGTKIECLKKCTRNHSRILLVLVLITQCIIAQALYTNITENITTSLRFIPSHVNEIPESYNLTYFEDSFVLKKKRNVNNEFNFDSIDHWVREIHRGKFDKIIRYAKSSKKANKSVYAAMPYIISKVYANDLNNFQNIFKLIYNLPDKKCENLEVLIKEMNKTNHLISSEAIQVAYEIKRLMNESTGYGWPPNQRKYENMKNSFPTNIRNLVWGKECCIRSTYWREYLCRSDFKYNTWTNATYVFTWIPCAKLTQNIFVFEPVDNNTSFKIRVAATNSYVIVDSHWFHLSYRHRRYVYAYDKGHYGENAKWKLEPINNRTFRIKYFGGAYLYSANMEYDNKRRHVFVSIQNRISPLFSWKIKCW